MRASSRRRAPSRTSSASSSPLPVSAVRSSTAFTRRGLRPRNKLVTEVAALGEDHRGAGGFYGGHNVGVALRAAGLDDRADAGVERELRPVGEWEERIA